MAEVAENVSTKEAGKTVVDLVLPMMAAAVDADNYELAGALGKVAETAARKSKVFGLGGGGPKAELRRSMPYTKASSACRFLSIGSSKTPMTPQANLELGKYFGLLRGHWSKALPLACHGQRCRAQGAGAARVGKSQNRPRAIALADGWWELAGKADNATQEQLDAPGDGLV